MPIRPSPSQVHINGPLTNLSVAYIQDIGGFVSNRVFPMVMSQHQSDSYYLYDKADWLADTVEERRPGTEATAGTYGLSTATFHANVYGYRRDVPDQVRANQDDPLSMDRDATEFVVQKAMIKKERDFLGTYFGSSAPNAVWSYVADGVGSSRTAAGSFDPTNASNNNVLQWNVANSTPIEDIDKGIETVLGGSGKRPNKLTLSRQVFNVLKNHTDIVGRLDRGQTTGPAIATTEAMARLFEVDEVLVADGVHSDGFIAGKNALLTYAPPSPSILTPSAGYSFMWSGLTSGMGEAGMAIKRYRLEHIACDVIELEMAYDHKVVSKDMGYLFNGIIA